MARAIARTGLSISMTKMEISLVRGIAIVMGLRAFARIIPLPSIRIILTTKTGIGLRNVLAEG